MDSIVYALYAGLGFGIAGFLVLIVGDGAVAKEKVTDEPSVGDVDTTEPPDSLTHDEVESEELTADAELPLTADKTLSKKEKTTKEKTKKKKAEKKKVEKKKTFIEDDDFEDRFERGSTPEESPSEELTSFEPEDEDVALRLAELKGRLDETGGTQLQEVLSIEESIEEETVGGADEPVEDDSLEILITRYNKKFEK